jgi:pimeloyl-ACP methyl ester carboxylesterase
MKLFLLLMSFCFFSNAQADLRLVAKRHFEFAERKLNLAEQNFSQLIDHKNLSMGNFNQRYWYDKTYAENNGSPVLLYICGEGSCRGPGSNIMAKAKTLKAHVFALEHRYYGESFPVANLETKNLQYLSIEQALSDLVFFKKAQAAKLGLTGKWIAIGGSYAGALAAYLRNQYPQDFVGALASSGPVKADLDFSEYDIHVANVAGGACTEAIQKVVEEIEEMIQTPEGFIAAKKEFNANKLNDKDDFLYLLADTAAGAVQYGMREKFCDLVVKNGKAGYIKGAAMVSQLFGNLEDLSAQAAMETKIDLGADIGMRQWFYQSCTEFGFWQNVNPDFHNRTRSVRINAVYHNNLCQRLFGMNANNVESTNLKYYAPILEMSASAILSPTERKILG